MPMGSFRDNQQAMLVLTAEVIQLLQASPCLWPMKGIHTISICVPMSFTQLRTSDQYTGEHAHVSLSLIAARI